MKGPSSKYVRLYRSKSWCLVVDGRGGLWKKCEGGTEWKGGLEHRQRRQSCSGAAEKHSVAGAPVGK